VNKQTKRKKAYDPSRHVKSLVDKNMARVLIAFGHCFEKQVDNIDHICNSGVSAKLLLKERVFKAKHRWECAIGIVQSWDHEEWIDWRIMTAESPLPIGSLQALMDKELGKLMGSRNQKHVKGYCWAAAPCGLQISEDDLTKYFTDNGVFDESRAKKGRAI
jgi:hypothetical protein